MLLHGARLDGWGWRAAEERSHNAHMSERDVAIVLSGGGMNGVLLELGFLRRLRDSSLWPRVGRIYGTSAGALAGRWRRSTAWTISRTSCSSSSPATSSGRSASGACR